jgi:hypothetical protein
MAKKQTRADIKKKVDDLIGETPTAVTKKVAAKKAAVKRIAAKKAAVKRIKTVEKALVLMAAHEGTDAIPAGYRMVKGVLIPPYPAGLETIEAGTKSPAVVEWYQKNHPEAAAALYPNL